MTIYHLLLLTTVLTRALLFYWGPDILPLLFFYDIRRMARPSP